MGGQNATRKGDKCTGHDACPPRPPITWSPDVFINTKNSVRQTDTYDTHGCTVHSPHTGTVVKGSSTVYVNNLQKARQGDPISCGSKCDEHSPDVIVGG
jgi:uncharacterized Zn-binding protein involved in type VI secretion